MIDFEAAADAAQQRQPTDEEIRGCSQIAEQIRRKEKAIENSERDTARLKTELATFVEVTLPTAMRSAGISEFKLLDGSHVTVGEEYYANIPAADSKTEELRARRAAAFAWLRANNNGDLIKNEMKAAFGRGDDEKASAFIAAAAEQGVMVAQSESVHWQTLKAWVREQIEKGRDIPLETFGVHIRNVATIEGPKKK